MSKNSTKSNVVAGSGPAVPTAPSSERTQPKEFANIDALLAQVPDPDGNSFAHWQAETLAEQGRDLIVPFADIFSMVGNDADDMEGRAGTMIAATILKRSGMMGAGRIISALCGSFAYSLAYAEVSLQQLMALNTRVQNEMRDGDREGIWGLTTAAERGVVTVNARQAECYRLGEIIRGAVEAYETTFGERFTLPQRAGRVSSKVQGEQAKAMTDRLAATLARFGKSAA